MSKIATFKIYKIALRTAMVSVPQNQHLLNCHLLVELHKKETMITHLADQICS